MVTLALKKEVKFCTIEIRLQDALTAFRALLPSAKYLAEWSGRVWEADAENNGGFAGFFLIWSAPYSNYSLQLAAGPIKLKFKKSAPNDHFNPTGWAAMRSENTYGILLKGR